MDDFPYGVQLVLKRAFGTSTPQEMQAFEAMIRSSPELTVLMGWHESPQSMDSFDKKVFSRFHAYNRRERRKRWLTRFRTWLAIPIRTILTRCKGIRGKKDR